MQFKVVINSDKISDLTSGAIWNQSGISLDSRVKEDSALLSLVDKALEPDNLNQYVVSADTASPTRCIDGRSQEEGSTLPLGAKVPGGTVHAAIAWRLSQDGDVASIVEDDVKSVIELFKNAGLGFGDHVDSAASETKTGCGAVDNIAQILSVIVSSDSAAQVKLLSSAILGDIYKEVLAGEAADRVNVLKEYADTYLSNGAYKSRIVGVLRNEADYEVMPVLKGQHNEVAAIVNNVSGLTLDNDKFNQASDSNIQVFDWDTWYMFKEAEALFSDQTLRLNYVILRTLLGVATVMVLTDGSLKLVSLTPVI